MNLAAVALAPLSGDPVKSPGFLPEPMPPAAGPTFFPSPARFDAWLARNGGKRPEVVVGFWKVGTGKPSMTWAQSVEVALRHGWIDGVRHSLGPDSYTIRFTPRKPTSNWSLVNVRTARRLVAEGRMTAAGLAAFKARKAAKTGVYSSEQPKDPRLSPAEEKALRADPKAWAGFSSRGAYYQRAVRWWILGAKRPETRERRFRHLLASSRAGRPVPPLVPRPSKKRLRASVKSN